MLIVLPESVRTPRKTAKMPATSIESDRKRMVKFSFDMLALR